MKLISSIKKYPKQWGIGFLVLIILGAIVQSLGYGSSDYVSSTSASNSSSVTTSSSSKLSEKSSPSSSSLESKQISIPDGYEKKFVELFDDAGLNPNDYIPEKLDVGVTVDFRADTKEFTGNYQNMTVDNLNDVFSNIDITVKDIISRLGRPEHIVIDRNFRTDGEETYGIEMTWEESATDDTLGSIKVEWPMSNDSNTVKSVVGSPVNRTTERPYQALQSIVELGEFKGAKYSNR